MVTCEIGHGIAMIEFGDSSNNPLDVQTAWNMSTLFVDLAINAEKWSIHTVYLLGRGNANFSSGMDIQALYNDYNKYSGREVKIENITLHVLALSNLFFRLRKLSNVVNVISVAKGRAWGAGLTLLAISNVSVACLGSTRKLPTINERIFPFSAGMPEIRMGLTYPYISAPYLIERMGQREFLQYMTDHYKGFAIGQNGLTQNMIDGDGALKRGFITHVSEISYVQIKKAIERGDTDILSFSKSRTASVENANEKSSIDVDSEKKFTREFGPALFSEISTLTKEGITQKTPYQTALMFSRMIVHDPEPLRTLVETLLRFR